MTATIPAPTPVRSRTLLVGTGFAIAATLMYFAGLFGIYLSERSATLASAEGATWIPADVRIELTAPTMIVWTLLMSIATMQWAVYSIARDDRRHAYMAIALTLTIGVMAIVQTSFQYQQMGFVADTSKAAVLVYAISGSHLAMLIGAMAFLVFVGFRALAGQYSSHQTDGVVAASLYWYAMVFVYFIIWIAVFITK